MQLIVQYKGQTARACAGLSACARRSLRRGTRHGSASSWATRCGCQLVPEEGDRPP